MLAPERDQSATRDAIKEIEIFLQRYPNSALMPDARQIEREAKDRLSKAKYRVGYFYFRQSGTPGRSIVSAKCCPAIRSTRGATRSTSIWPKRSTEPIKKAEALPYYERLLREFEQSEYLADTQKRVAELKGATPGGR